MELLLVIAGLLAAATASPPRSEVGVHFMRMPESVSAPLGDEVAFECAASVPAERFAWRRRARQATRWSELGAGQPGVRLAPPKPQTSKIMVKLLHENMTGEYRCIAMYGGMALASTAAQLTVARLEPPRTPATPAPRPLHAARHNSLALHCVPPSSSPPAQITYYKIGSPNSQIHSDDGTLVIANAGPSDSGLYACNASNDISGQMVVMPWKVALKIRDNQVDEAPRFLENVKEVTGQHEGDTVVAVGAVGSALRLACGAVGHPVPHVTWKMANGTNFLATKESRPKDRWSIEPGTQFLMVEALRTEDENIYTCMANNRLGSVERRFRVRARRGARVRGEAHASHAAEGGGARVTCGEIDGEPAPNVEWLINGETVLDDPKIHFEDGDLVINPVEKRHAGIVQCLASNELGSDYGAALLSVIPRQISGQDNQSPSELGTFPAPMGEVTKRNRKQQRKHVVLIPPSRPTITRLTDESVMVHWSVDKKEGLPILFFKVQYRDISQGGRGERWQTSNQDIQPHVFSYEVDDLEPDHIYRFRIAAVYSNNDNKLGENSAKFHLQRGVSARGPPPPAPRLHSALSVSPTQIQMLWNFTNQGAPVDGFYAYYREASSAGEYLKVTVDGERERALMLSHLAPDTPYELKLQSFTASAASEFSEIIMQRTLKNKTAGADTALDSETDKEVRGGGAAEEEVGGLGPVAGAAGGGAALLGVLLLALLLCRRRRTDAKEQTKVAVTENGGPTSNGFAGGKQPPPITITANPLHSEGSDVDVEMSYLSAHNNNYPRASPPASEADEDSPPPSPVTTSPPAPLLSCRNSLSRPVNASVITTPIAVGAGRDYV